jgi:predicted permease
MGRLKPGITVSAAQAELDAIFGSVLEAANIELPPDTRRPEMFLLSGAKGTDTSRWRYSRSLWTLLAIVGLVLLIACANVANLLLARATSRRKEITVRLALGAKRSRLVRQLLTESMLLSMISGAFGLLLSYWGSHALVTMVSAPDAVRLSLGPDARVLGFTGAVCILTGILFGLAPAVRASRVNLAPALKEGTAIPWTSRSSEHTPLLGRSLIVLQVALSLLLLVGAGLFLRTLRNLNRIEIGFQSEGLLLFGINPTLNGYSGERLANVYRQVYRGLESVPGVISATASRHRLLSGWMSNTSIKVHGSAPPSGKRMRVAVNHVGPGFFETMGIPILLGRGPTERDTAKAPLVAFVNETAARRYFVGGSPIGKTFRWRERRYDGPDVTVAGVVKDARYDKLKNEVESTIYVPYEQSHWGFGRLNFAVRTAGRPEAVVGAIRAALREIDANLPMIDIKTQQRQIADGLRQERLFARLSTTFAVLAVVLACIGIYGVMSYSVARRTGEIGIRMAFGARYFDIAWLVLRQSVVLVAIGVVAGLAATLAATRLVSAMLYGIEPNDPATLAATALIIIATSLAAAYLPARKAARVNPMDALRCE